MVMAYMQKKNKQTKGACNQWRHENHKSRFSIHASRPPQFTATTFPGYLSLPPPLPRTPLLSLHHLANLETPLDRPGVGGGGQREREMGPQRKLVYSFVARGSALLADHAEASGNFATVAAECLQKLPASNNRFSYNCDGHTFNYHVHDGFSNVPDLDVPCCSSPF
jgi:hypothetical protein